LEKGMLSGSAQTRTALALAGSAAPTVATARLAAKPMQAAIMAVDGAELCKIFAMIDRLLKLPREHH
jgi:hypothetical protein